MGMMSTEAINGLGEVGKAAGRAFFGGLIDMGKALNSGKSLGVSAYKGFGAREGDALSFALCEHHGKKIHWSGAKIAGGVAGLGIGYRFLSGGGAYRDKNGNTDIAGLPFV